MTRPHTNDTSPSTWSTASTRSTGSASPTSSTTDVSALIDAARAARSRAVRTGRRKGLLVSVAVVAVWVPMIIATGQVARVMDNGSAAVTMIFGSFVAGSTPQGGGAVAFPVFTKLLRVSASDARTFSLCIQAVGMGSAALAIWLTRRPVDTRAIRVTVPSAVGGFLAGSWLFAAATPPAPYVKVAFTLIVAAAGAATWHSRRGAVIEQRPAAPQQRPAINAALLTVSALGGVASAVFGSGADVAVYVLLAIVLGVRPSVSVATSVVTMAAVSIVGLALAVSNGDLVLTERPSTGIDVPGMWLAAIPVVAIGAPFGSWFADRVSTAALARFIAALAALELLTTVLFLDELRTDPSLALFLVGGISVTALAIRRMNLVRDHIATVTPDAAVVRRLDVELNIGSVSP